MNNPLVTVLITAYNSKYIDDAIKSINEQKYRPIEILIVDDGSSPKLKYLTRLTSKHTIKYIHIKHKGLPHGLIKGMNVAKGKYIAILDHDNMLSKNSIDLRIKFFKKNKSLALVYGNIEYVNSQGKHIMNYEFENSKNNNEFIKKVIINSSPQIEHNTIMFNKQFAKNVGGYNPNSPQYFDLELIIKLAKKYPIKHIHAIVAKYRVHQNNFSSKNPYKWGGLKRKIKLIDEHLNSPLHNKIYKCKVFLSFLLNYTLSKMFNKPIDFPFKKN